MYVLCMKYRAFGKYIANSMDILRKEMCSCSVYIVKAERTHGTGGGLWRLFV